MELFWQLPGPRRFLEQVEEDLRAGTNVVLLLPKDGVPDLRAALRRHLSDEWVWHSTDTRQPDSPSAIVFRELVPDYPPRELRNARSLANCEAFTGYLVWLDGLNARNWGQWKSFLSEYEHACRARPQFGRSLFLAPLVGELALDPPETEICLRCREWRDVVGELDMMLFADVLLRRHSVPVRQRMLLATTIAKVALWDPELATRMAALAPRQILQPQAYLQQIAAERGWTSETPRRWELGTENRVDGRDEVHSALLALGDGEGVLSRRLWSAQVSVLLPLVEERRRMLLPRLSRELGIVSESGCGAEDALLHLELGEIAQRLSARCADSRLRQRVIRLRNIRNALAHLEVLPPEEALDAELYALSV
jgi:hypothetical protein